MRRRGRRKRALGTYRSMLVPDRTNARWSLDFLFGSISDGRRFRVLVIVENMRAEVVDWYAMFAPLGTAKEVIAKLHASAGEILQAPEVNAALEVQAWSRCSEASAPRFRTC